MSSADPAEISLSIKGVLVGVVPYLMFAIGLAHLNVGQDQLNAIIDGGVTVLQDALMLVSTCIEVDRKIRTAR